LNFSSNIFIKNQKLIFYYFICKTESFGLYVCAEYRSIRLVLLLCRKALPSPLGQGGILFFFEKNYKKKNKNY
jgi:hypothetical protein